MSYSYAFSDRRPRRRGFGSWTAWVSWHLGLLSSSILMIVDGCGLVRLPEWLPFLVLGVGLLCTLAAETATGSLLAGGRCGRSHEILGQSMLVLYLIGLLVRMQVPILKLSLLDLVRVSAIVGMVVFILGMVGIIRN